MNVKRFTARTSREALALVKAAFGEDAVVMSTKPCAEGVEVLAMAPESVQQLERVGAAEASAARQVAVRERTAGAPGGVAPRAAAAGAVPAAGGTWGLRPPTRLIGRTADRGERTEPHLEPHLEPHPEPHLEPHAGQNVAQDVEQLQMSTLSFQDYVRERMLRRREAERSVDGSASAPADRVAAPMTASPPVALAKVTGRTPALQSAPASVPHAVAPIEAARARHAARREMPLLQDDLRVNDALHDVTNDGRNDARSAAEIAAGGASGAGAGGAAAQATRGDQIEMMSELRSMRGLIEQRFGALAFMEKLQRQPRQAQLAQRLLDTGFSPALIRKLVESLPAEGDAVAWAAGILERNLPTGEREPALEDVGGVYALIGATGVGKTTSTAKLAAAFATRHGATNLGLVTLDAYRVGAHEQLRTYGRILGVPVHTAHDRASLEDLLELLAGKRMVLIDTAGMAQRDSRTRELLDMLTHRAINRLLVVNASAQGETIEDQLAAYAAPGCRGLILSKMDEAVKLGPALDSMIRHKLKVLAIANGQRVPEDWHRLSASALVQRALRGGGGPAWKLDGADVHLIFSGLPAAVAHGVPAHG